MDCRPEEKSDTFHNDPVIPHYSVQSADGIGIAVQNQVGGLIFQLFSIRRRRLRAPYLTE